MQGDLLSGRIVIDCSIAPTMDEAQIDRMQRSGVTVFNWTVCEPWSGRERALEEIAIGRALIEADDRLALVTSADDIRAAHQSGQVGLIFGPQNSVPVEVIDRDLDVLHDAGVRILQLTYNEQNPYGSGCAVPEDGGVTDLGRELIREVEARGIVLDLSHGGERTILEAIEASEAPPIISHANARAVYPSRRNATDDILHMLAERGGVIGMTLWSPMVGGGDRRPTVEDFLRHVEYVIDLIGVEHVGIGSDHSEGHPRNEWDQLFGRNGRYPGVTAQMGDWYGYDTRFVEDGSSCLDLRGVAARLADLGLDGSELDGILGGNFLRVFENVWN